MDAAGQAELRAIIDAALRGELDEPMAVRVYELGADATSAVMLAVNARIAEFASSAGPPGSFGPHAPSASIPPYAKPRVPKRRGRPGARDGHEGRRRPTPEPGEFVEVEALTRCPECDGEVHRATRRRRRTIEDMPEGARIKATEYSIPSHWCPKCRKPVEPRIGAALARASIGNRLAAMTIVFHYGLGLTIDQTRYVLLNPLRTRVSAGGLADLWRRIAEVLLPWYERIGVEARSSAVLHADETGWRVNGRTHWLWCFCNHANCCYLIDESRGGDVLKAFFTESFKGVLMSDFWGPYQSVVLEEKGERQCCLAHLLREIDHVDADAMPHKPPDHAEEWAAFAKLLRRLLRDGIRLRERKDFTPAAYASRIAMIDRRLIALAEHAYGDPDAKRLAARLSRRRDELFTFLDRPEAAWNNNFFAERQIRPAVILRKNSQCNRSERGAATQAVLMSIHRTLILRGIEPQAAITAALTVYAATGTLPAMPAAVEVG